MALSLDKYYTDLPRGRDVSTYSYTLQGWYFAIFLLDTMLKVTITLVSLF